MAKEKPELSEQMQEVIRMIRIHNRNGGSGVLRKEVAEGLDVSVWKARKLITQAETILAGTPRVCIDPNDPLFRSEVARHIKRATTAATVANKMHSTEEDVLAVVDDLEECGYIILRRGNTVQLGKSVEHTAKGIVFENHFHDKPISFGVIADMHLCSKAERLDVLIAAYDEFARRGINTVVCPGNYIDGECRFNTHELLAHGIADQCQYAIDHWPSKPGIKTYYVDGDDHEGWFQQRDGIEFGRYLMLEAQAQGRDDLVYMGYMEADFELKAPQGSAIVKVIHAGGGSSYAFCHDDTTEILTQDRGWQLFRDIVAQDAVATLNEEKDSMEWQIPQEVIGMPYKGNMVKFTSRVIDMLVTPNHRMYTRRYPLGINRLNTGNLLYPTKSHPTITTQWQFIDAESLLENYSRQKWQFKTSCKTWDGVDLSHVSIPPYRAAKYGHSVKEIESIDIDLMIELAGWFITEGSIDKTRKQVCLCQDKKANPENWEYVKEVCEKIGLGFWNGGRNDKDFSISSKRLAMYMEEQFGRTSKDKMIPKWMKNLPTHRLKKLLDICILGDGWIANKSFGYKSISKQLRHDISEIAIKCGYGVTEHGDTVNIRCLQNEPTINQEPENISYDGMVYCVTVSNGIILTRRNGKPCWSGNSYASQKLVESMQGGEKPAVCIIGHYHKMEFCFPRNVYCVQAGCMQDQTRFMRKRKLAAHVGFGVITLQQDIKGSITRFVPEFFPFWDRGYYLKRDGITERLQKGV